MPIYTSKVINYAFNDALNGLAIVNESYFTDDADMDNDVISKLPNYNDCDQMFGADNWYVTQDDDTQAIYIDGEERPRIARTVIELTYNN